jgi:hypothetical protein
VRESKEEVSGPSMIAVDGCSGIGRWKPCHRRRLAGVVCYATYAAIISFMM